MGTTGDLEIDETTSALGDQDALADISEADEAYRHGDAIRGADTVRRLHGQC